MNISKKLFQKLKKKAKKILPNEVKAFLKDQLKGFKSQELNKIVLEAQKLNPPTMQGRFRPKIKFVNLGNVTPPTFIFHGNKLEKLDKNYKKFLENYLRKNLKLKGIPIQLIFKSNENPFHEKKNKLTKRQYAKRKRVRSH